jgi:hypothetical protein
MVNIFSAKIIDSQEDPNLSHPSRCKNKHIHASMNQSAVALSIEHNDLSAPFKAAAKISCCFPLNSDSRNTVIHQDRRTRALIILISSNLESRLFKYDEAFCIRRCILNTYLSEAAMIFSLFSSCPQFSRLIHIQVRL